jgi:hypothetical protein
MRAYGTDRVGKAEDGRIAISSQRSKGWTARIAATMTRGQRQGTAILWDDDYFEVVEAEVLPNGGLRYVLEPWREEDVMRVSEAYDEESEARRLEEYRKSIAREKKRKSANLLGVFTGHLPAVVQQEMAFELGVNPPRLTMISALPLIPICGIPCFLFVAAVIAGTVPPIPIGVFIPLAYLTAESIFRMNMGFMGNTMGSLAGFIFYALYDALAGKKATRKRAFDGEKGSAITITEAPPDVALQDAFIVREAFITLLSPAEQQRALERFDYDYRKQSWKIATIILIFAVIGFASALSTRAAIPSLIAAAVALEQIWRLIAFRTGPTGSVFGFVARPFVRKLLR